MAYQPINYMAAMPRPADLTGSILSGLQLGSAFRGMQEQQAQREAAQQRAQQYQAAIGAAMQNPTPQAFAALALQFPEHREAYKQSWDQLNGERQQNELKDMGTLGAALQSGRPDIAQKQLEARIKTMKDSGVSTDRLETLLDLVKTAPDKAYGAVLRVASGVPGGDKLIESWSKLGADDRAQQLQPAAMKKADAEAAKATVEAKYADSMALADLEKKGWDVKNIQSEIGYRKESNRIQALNAAIARETNGLKREELQLKVQEMRQKLDENVRTKAADIEGARSSIDNLLNTADRILKVDSGTRRAAMGTIDSRLPTIQQDVADFEELAAGLGSQAFIAQIPAMKGSGAISEKEGDKLQASLQNLSLRQSENQFEYNIREVQRLMLKARNNLSTRYGLPNTVPDTPAAAPSQSEVDDLLKKYLR